MVLLDLNDLVTPGWVPLLLTGILALACVFLVLNMRKQLRRIDVPKDPRRVESAPFPSAGDQRTDT